MSTRCTINFGEMYKGKFRGEAKIYRHSDGYPNEHGSGIAPDMVRFFRDVRSGTKDTRFNNPNYLAAKYVVWQADQNAYTGDLDGDRYTWKRTNKLDFLSVGVVTKDPQDIEYTYRVITSDNGGAPRLQVAERLYDRNTHKGSWSKFKDVVLPDESTIGESMVESIDSGTRNKG